MSAASVAVHSKPHRHSVAVIVGYCDSVSESYVTMVCIFRWGFKKSIVCYRVGYFLSGILVYMNMI